MLPAYRATAFAITAVRRPENDRYGISPQVTCRECDISNWRLKVVVDPGISITHQAVALLADHGATAIWVGERGVRYYAHGRSLAASSRLLVAQAEAVSHRGRRLAVARTMYAMRFPGEDTAGLTMQQLRGKEGARVRRLYRQQAERTGVAWHHRDYDQADFAAGDPINQALSAAHACLYGIVHTVIVALGAAPGLGFVHTGHERAFVYDIADLYKAEITIPVAFDVVAGGSTDIAADTRRAVRDRVHDGAILSRCVRDIRMLLLQPQAGGEVEDAEELRLWDDAGIDVTAGRNYADTGEVDF